MDSNVFMSKIEMIEGQIMEEVDGSKSYQMCSDRWADENSSFASAYATMAKQELEHATRLNNFLSEMKGLTEDQLAVVRFLYEMNGRQIKKASADK